MARRIELGAGVATITLALLAALLLLFAPLVPFCASGAHACATSEVRYRSLLQSHLGAGDWALALLPAAIALLGGVGAVVDARRSGRMGIVALGLAFFLGLIVCALGATGLGVVYLPAILGLGLASYGAFLRRRVVELSDDIGV
jgi:hypothetical protein